MTTYTRNISRIDAEDQDGLIGVGYNVHWRVTCVEDNTISAYGTQSLDSPDPDNFTPLEDVTESNVLAWLGEDFWSEIETNLTEKYNIKQTSTKTFKNF
jgi:hypothetical protein